MIRVNNQKVIGRLSRKTLKANRFRNGMAVFAIMLTTLLFSALFTIAGTMVRTSEGETFRQAGGDMHGTFKDVTLEEKEILKKDPMIVKAGERLVLGMADGEFTENCPIWMMCVQKVLFFFCYREGCRKKERKKSPVTAGFWNVLA